MSTATEPRNEASALEDHTQLLSPEQEQSLHQALQQRRAQLLQDLKDGAELRAGADRYSAIKPEAADAGETSVATEQSDLRQLQIGRDVGELRQVDAALARMTDGVYGYCIDCGRLVGVARLQVNPSAERCLSCQTVFERRYAHLDSATPPVTRQI